MLGIKPIKKTSVCVCVSRAPGVDVVLVPGRGLVEGDLRVVGACRGVDEGREGLLERVVEEAGGAGLGQADPVGRERGLGVVEEAGADGVGRGLLLGGEEKVDPGRVGPLRALVEEDLGQGVGREGLVEQKGACAVPRGEADASRPVDPPRAEGDGLGQGPDCGRRKAGGLEGGEEGARGGRCRVVEHGLEAGGRVRVVVVHDDARELPREADLAHAADDLVEARVGRGRQAGGVGALVVGLVVEARRGLEPEPAVGSGSAAGEELELERGPGPAGGVYQAWVWS